MTDGFACLLENRGVIGLGGADRRSFLQGMISNDINLCSTERAIYAALLTPQGKFLHDLFIIESGDEFLIDCEAARAEDLIKRLTAYKLRAKVEIHDRRTEYGVGVSGDQHSAFGIQGIYPDPRLSKLGLRAFVRKKDSLNADRRMLNAYDRHRLSLGIADGSRDMLVEKSTLAEGNFDFLNGISWSKGCYVGQELTARMHYRGLAKKRLFPVEISGPSPASGTPVTVDGQEVGDMRSSEGDTGLALLSIEKIDAPLVCGDSKLTATKPAWMDLEKK